MRKRTSRAEAQFRYWDLRRRAMSQSDIARKHEITRQAVSKMVKLQERDILARLLDHARTSRVLAEWVSADKGLLIGQIPQLGNLSCLVVVDTAGKLRMFYGSSGGEPLGEKELSEMKGVLRESLGLSFQEAIGFRDILEALLSSAEVN